MFCIRYMLVSIITNVDSASNGLSKRRYMGKGHVKPHLQSFQCPPVEHSLWYQVQHCHGACWSFTVGLAAPLPSSLPSPLPYILTSSPCSISSLHRNYASLAISDFALLAPSSYFKTWFMFYRTPSLTFKVTAGHPLLGVIRVPCTYHQQSNMKGIFIPGGQTTSLGLGNKTEEIKWNPFSEFIMWR